MRWRSAGKFNHPPFIIKYHSPLSRHPPSHCVWDLKKNYYFVSPPTFLPLKVHKIIIIIGVVWFLLFYIYTTPVCVFQCLWLNIRLIGDSSFLNIPPTQTIACACVCSFVHGIDYILYRPCNILNQLLPVISCIHPVAPIQCITGDSLVHYLCVEMAVAFDALLRSISNGWLGATRVPNFIANEQQNK